MISEKDYDAVKVSVEPFDTVSALEGSWRDLENRASFSVFLSWPWIGTWLQCAESPLSIMRMRHGDKVIALGVFAHSNASRTLGGAMPVLGLHEVSETPLGKIATEYNGLLCETGWEAIAHRRLAQWLSHEHVVPDASTGGSGLVWRECRLPGLCSDHFSAVQAGAGVHRLYRKSDAPHVSLTDSFSNLDHYLKTLTKNARHQIRRSLRRYETRGAISLHRPSTEQAAMACVDRLSLLHTSQWEARGKPGAFSNGAFVQFHHKLIQNGFSQGVVDLLEVKAGQHTIGILYNLVYGGCVAAYQSGFTYEDDNRLKPGLLCHALAISDYASSGFETYNFLAGDQRYKRSLATDADTLYWVAIQRPDIRMRIESALRNMKAKFKGGA